MYNKILTLLLFTFILIGGVSALTIYSGETIELELDKPYEYYSIVGNSTEVILDITQEGNKITITPNIYSLEDEYEIVFFDREKETITIHTSSGGGTTTKWKTEYVNNTITKYVDKKIEVLGETIEIIKEVEVPAEQSNLFKILFGIALLIIFLFVVYSLFSKNELKGGLNEQEKIIN